MFDKLYIIGNGFDLHHDLKTSYKHFRDNYAIKKKYVWEKLYKFYGLKIYQDGWWSDFEIMLGKIDYSHLMNSINGAALGPNDVRNFLMFNLRTLFGEWIKTIDCNCQPDQSIAIEKDSLFFTFNYTLLLENVYGIKDDNVWHIHNSIKDSHNGINPIVGHDTNMRQLMQYVNDLRNDNPAINIDFAHRVNNDLLKGAKKVSSIIANNDEKFSQYSSIKHFVAMGFSFNDIDMPYIKKIIESNYNISEADWTLYWHSGNEISNMISQLKALGINESNIQQCKW